jgi:hypothetical protein
LLICRDGCLEAALGDLNTTMIGLLAALIQASANTARDIFVPATA